MFALPINIFGTGLAIKLKEQQKSVLYRNPASKLIQTIWRCYATDKKSKSTATWIWYRKSDEKPITETDKQCIRFIRILKYLMARRRLKQTLYSQSDEDNHLRQLELKNRVEYIENIVKDNQTKAYVLRRRLRNIRLTLKKININLDSNTSSTKK
jgi:hypothetical protein